jgi:glycosyltransferase involved in cell wall biosynthesis
MLALGHESRLFVGTSLTRDPTIVPFSPPTDLLSRLRRRARAFHARRALTRHGKVFHSAVDETFTDGRSVNGGDPLSQLPAADIVNAHNLVPLVDEMAFLAAVPRRCPVVRTLHDMNAFTGGCHYDAGCGRHEERCGDCPQLPDPGAADLSHRIWRRKRAALRRVPPGRLHFVTPSRWLADELRRSSLLGAFPVTVIPNAVDTTLFRPVARTAAREFLRIQPDAVVVLFVAEPVTRRVKGFAMLTAALQAISHPRLLLLSAGTGMPPAEAPCQHLHLGHVGDERLLPLVYGAADLFVIPSTQDNCPQAILESLACGVPIIGYASGGIPELVRDHETGLLVPVGDVRALSAALQALLGEPERRVQMAASCRRVALQEYTRELQARRYVDLYESLLEAAAIDLPSAAGERLEAAHGPAR